MSAAKPQPPKPPAVLTTLRPERPWLKPLLFLAAGAVLLGAVAAYNWLRPTPLMDALLDAAEATVRKDDARFLARLPAPTRAVFLRRIGSLSRVGPSVSAWLARVQPDQAEMFGRYWPSVEKAVAGAEVSRREKRLRVKLGPDAAFPEQVTLAIHLERERLEEGRAYVDGTLVVEKKDGRRTTSFTLELIEEEGRWRIRGLAGPQTLRLDEFVTTWERILDAMPAPQR